MIFELLPYINMIGGRLEGFKQVRSSVWNSRCPICGDSKKKNKRRFYIHENKEKTTLMVSCRNCDYASSLLNFMKEYHIDIYHQAIFDIFRNKAKSEKKDVEYSKVIYIPKVEEVVEPTVTTDYGLIPLDEVSLDNPVLKYALGRCIPIEMLSRLSWCANLKTFASQFEDYKDSNLPSDSCLLIPFYDFNNKLTHIQARSINPNAYLRYVTFKIDDRASKWFGCEKLDPKLIKYVVEGPIDSLFIPNCIATADANLLSYPMGDVYIPDNQYRNPEICEMVKRIILSGKKIVLFPETFQYKDINDAIKDGFPLRKLYQIIINNTYSGFNANLKWSSMKKYSKGGLRL